MRRIENRADLTLYADNVVRRSRLEVCKVGLNRIPLGSESFGRGPPIRERVPALNAYRVPKCLSEHVYDYHAGRRYHAAQVDQLTGCTFRIRLAFLRVVRIAISHGSPLCIPPLDSKIRVRQRSLTAPRCGRLSR